ncbi:MAG: 2-amino-4-hydroxy-6-hydroxymethyldihydropteridine diphosphokinase [Prevotella sp.]|nr:2-amino-4-hydroxy-6-hydroxymethyldihydropteridine diphosphokinase [Prevotella sp.]
MTETHVTYLGLGTNIGDKEANIRIALEKIQESVGDIVRQSTLYVSEPWGFESENLFVNTVACVHTALSPRQLLSATQRIEKQMGRKRKSRNGVYHDRVIDIDILLYDDLHISLPDLVIPHPLMRQRDFVMIPLREILEPSDCSDCSAPSDRQ